MRKYVNHNYFDCLGSNQYYILGFFAADGNSIEHGKTGYAIRFQLKDLSLVEKIKRELKSEHKITIRKLGERQYYGLKFSSSKIRNFLCSFFGMPVERKSMTIKWPTKLPKKYARDFVRGVIDGDGCIYVSDSGYPLVKIVSGSKHLIDGMSLCIESMVGIKSKVQSVYGNNHIYEIIFRGFNAFCLAYYVYCGSELYLERKREKIELMLNWVKTSKPRKLSSITIEIFRPILKKSFSLPYLVRKSF